MTVSRSYNRLLEPPTSDLATRLLPLARAYLLKRPQLIQSPFAIAPLAQGEYNLNYLVSESAGERRKVVLRISTGSQEIATGADQILYEANALRLLAPLGIAPALHHVDPSATELPYGLLVEEFLPGRPLDYSLDADVAAAARTLAALHTFQPDQSRADRPLVRIDGPLSSFLSFGIDMAAHYRVYPGASHDALRILGAVETALRRLAPLESDHFPPHLRGVVHTDVQAHNFIVADSSGSQPTARMVDWEKPLVDDPTYDLAHFLAVTTTRWKCGVDLHERQRRLFLDTYKAAAEAHRPAFTHDLDRRLALRQPFVHWRAITWCAMAWVEYQRPDRTIKNADTAARIAEYLQPPFLAALFDPVLSSALS